MKKIREALLQQYVGAIAIGFIVALGISTLINTLIKCSATYWMILEDAKTNYRTTPSFPWNNLIIAVISVTLYLSVAYGLARWLYFPHPKNPSVTSDPDSPTETTAL